MADVLADVFSSETGAAGAPSRPLPQAEATVSTENTSPLARSLKKAGVGEPEHIRQGGCGERKRGSGREGGLYFLSAKLGGCFDAGGAENACIRCRRNGQSPKLRWYSEMNRDGKKVYIYIVYIQ